MSRLTDLLRQARKLDAQLGADLEAEFGALANKRSFGLVFEPHQPEAVELPGRPVRRGDKVRVLPPRGSKSSGDKRLWRVSRTHPSFGSRQADLIELDADSPETPTVLVEDLVVVAEFRDRIYPGLVETGRVERGGDKPFHTVINAENFHALEMLTYTHRHAIDVIYIDPPYNTGAKDWKYNNDYVASDDDYRHSKWLAMMERRLRIARELLNPDDSVLIVTIDEKEYLRLGLLLEQTFPEATIQMVSSVINPKGTARATHLSRTDEYLFFVFLGDFLLPSISEGGEATEIRWRYLRRTDVESRRGTSKGGKAQFYPIYVNADTGQIEMIGDALPHKVDRNVAPSRSGCISVFPIRESDGIEMNWGLTGPSLQKALDRGFVRCSRTDSSLQPFVFQYLTEPNIRKIEAGQLEVVGTRPDGSQIVVLPGGKVSRPTTAWRQPSHDAGAYGTSLLRSLIPDRKFPFPKSLYAVEDALRLATLTKPNAVIFDFFSGSGTTAHAVMRLNRQDGGRRQSISITNNEVSAEEQVALRAKGLRPGDPDWEAFGICDFITKPRITAAITGVTPSGEPINGDYKFTDEFPMSEGFEENAAFFTLTYESSLSVRHNRAFERIAPILWMRAGSQGRIIQNLGSRGWDVADSYAVLENLDQVEEFVESLANAAGVELAFIVTDDDGAFQMVCRELPESVTPVRLYESYLQNFEINMGRSL